MNRMVDAVEFVRRIPLAAFLYQIRRALKHPAIQFIHLLVSDHIARRIEAVEIPQRETNRIADLPIGLAELRHHPLAHLHVRLIFLRADPQAKQVRAPLVANLRRQHHVAEGLRHRPALFVQCPPMGHHAAIRRLVADARGDQQRTVKPPAILVGPLQINVRGPFVAFQHSEMRRPGIEPHVQNVVFLTPFFRTARTFCSRGQQLLRGVFVPGVSALFFKPLHHVAQRHKIIELLAARIAEKHDNRHTPEALPRNAPVRPLLDHFVDTFFAPAGNPLNLVNFLQRFLAQRLFRTVRGLIHLDEPLLRGAKDYRIVAAPAVRVAMLIRMVPQQRAMFGEQLHDDRIRREDVLAFVFRQAFGIHALVIQRRVNLQPIFLPGIKVVRAVARSRVHDAAALIQRDVIRQQARHLNRQKRMLKLHPLEIAALETRQFLSLLDVAIGLESGNAIRSQQQLSLFRRDHHVLVVRVKRQPAVVRNRPRCRGPDHGGNIPANLRGLALSAANNFKGHPD